MNDPLQIKLCEGIAEALQNVVELASDGAVVFVEDKFNPRTKVSEHANTKLRVMISTTGHTRRPGGGKSTAGDIGVEIVVFENPVRRVDPNALTVTRAAELIAETLHWKTFDGFDKLRYIDMSRADADESDFRMVVNFAAFAALDPANAVRWGIGDDIHLGEVTSKSISRGGTPIFESNRKGEAFRIGTRDPHWAIDLSADVYAAITEDDLPAMGEPFGFGERTYFTTAASLAEAGEDTTTVRLAGRTIKGD